MIEEKIRPFIQPILFDKLAEIMSKYFTGNQITLFSLIFGLMALPLIALQIKFLATIFLIFSGMLDVLDGTISRLRNESSIIGAVYDIMSDRAVEVSVLIGLFLIEPNTRGLQTLTMLGAILLCVTSFLLAGISEKHNKENKSFSYSPGLIERAEAFMFFTLMIWLPNYFTHLSILFSILVIYTAVRRVFEMKNHCSSSID